MFGRELGVTPTARNPFRKKATKNDMNLKSPPPTLNYTAIRTSNRHTGQFGCCVATHRVIHAA
jgi:hypothetical protein